MGSAGSAGCVCGAGVCLGGAQVVAQSNACMAFLGRRLGLWGTTEAEASACEAALCEAMDLRDMMVRNGGRCSKN